MTDLGRSDAVTGALVAHLRASFAHALRAGEPGALVAAHLPAEPPDVILAVGKAALGMLAPARELAPRAAWLATPPAGSAVEDARRDGAGRVLPGSHPLPGEGSAAAATAALASVARLEARQRVLLLLSGGGSALWAAPRGIDLADKRGLTQQLLLAGADIAQLNTVRKHLSAIKGGRLAQASRATFLTLALSDVPGDDPGTIASGPTVPDPTTYADALAVLAALGVTSAAAAAHLEAGSRGEVDETPKPGDALEARSQVEVVASNRTLIEAAASYWRGHGFPTVVQSDALQGDARTLARAHADVAAALVRGEDPTLPLALLARQGDAARTVRELAAAVGAGGATRPVVLVSGGEATVTVTGDGRGGRNQEFALWLHHYLRSAGVDGRVVALAAGSDGVDGNSPAAGAVITPATAAAAEDAGLSPAASLARNDSHTFFSRLGDEVVTGPTGTNLNDYRALVVLPG